MCYVTCDLWTCPTLGVKSLRIRDTGRELVALKILAIHGSLWIEELVKLQEIKAQNSLNSDDEVLQYLVTRHKYQCLVERIASSAESEPQNSISNSQLPSDSAMWNHIGTKAQHSLASLRNSVPCSNNSIIKYGST